MSSLKEVTDVPSFFKLLGNKFQSRVVQTRQRFSLPQFHNWSEHRWGLRYYNDQIVNVNLYYIWVGHTCKQDSFLSWRRIDARTLLCLDSMSALTLPIPECFKIRLGDLLGNLHTPALVDVLGSEQRTFSAPPIVVRICCTLLLITSL